MILMQSQGLDHFCSMLLLYDVLSESCSVSLLTESKLLNLFLYIMAIAKNDNVCVKECESNGLTQGVLCWLPFLVPLVE